MADWGFLGELFEAMQTHSPLLGRLWLQIMLVFRMLILGTVASDLFEDEQEQFECNTAQPGCKQVCYDQAFPISQYRFWVFHIVLISTPALLFLMYSVHLRSKTAASHQASQVSAGVALPGKPVFDSMSVQQDLRVTRLYMLNVGFRFLAEVAFLLGQWALYGFHVAAQYPCSRFPCPYTVDCFTSRPMEKTIFLCFYFAVGLLSALFSLAELVHVFVKWRRRRRGVRGGKGGSGDGEMGAVESRSLHSLPLVGGGDGGVSGLQRGESRGEGGRRGQLYPGRGRSGPPSASGSWRKGRRVSLGGWSSSSSRNASNAGRKSRQSGSQKLDMLMV